MVEQREECDDLVKLEVESTGVADRLSCSVSPPQRGCYCLTVHTVSSFSSGHGLKTHETRFWFCLSFTLNISLVQLGKTDLRVSDFSVRKLSDSKHVLYLTVLLLGLSRGLLLSFCWRLQVLHR